MDIDLRSDDARLLNLGDSSKKRNLLKKKPSRAFSIVLIVSISIFLVIVGILGIYFVSESFCFESEFPKSHPLRRYYDFKTKSLIIPKGTDIGKQPILIEKMSKLTTVEIAGNCFGNATGLVIRDLPKLITFHMEAMTSFINGDFLTIENLPRMKTLYFQCHHCFNTITQFSLKDFPSLEKVNVVTNTGFVSVTDIDLRNLPSLSFLWFNNPYSLNNVTSLHLKSLPSLTAITVNGFKGWQGVKDVVLHDLKSLPDFSMQMSFACDHMTSLHISDCPKLKLLYQRTGTYDPTIEDLTLKNLPALEKIDFGMGHLPNLKNVVMQDLNNLTSIILCTNKEKCITKLESIVLHDLPKLSMVRMDPIADICGLKSIRFENLPSFNRAISSNYTRFVDLKEVELINLPSLENMTFSNVNQFPVLEALTLQNLPSFRKLIVNSTEFVEVNKIVLNDLPLLNHFEVSGKQAMSANNTDKGSIFMKKVPSCPIVQFSSVSSCDSSLYSFKYVYRGESVCSNLYSHLLDHLHTNGKYKDSIEEKEWI